MAIPTGRTRPVQATGIITGTSIIFLNDFSGQIPPPTPRWEQNFHTLTIQFLGCYIEFHTVLANTTATRELQLSCYTGPGFGAGSSDFSNVTEFVSTGETWTIPLEGTFAILGEVEEWLYVQGTGYPGYGGTPIPDPPLESRATYTDRLVVGSTLSVTATIAGMMVSASVTVDEDRRGTPSSPYEAFEYPLTLGLIGEGRGKPISLFGFDDLAIALGGNTTTLSGSLEQSGASHSITASGADGKFYVDCTQFTKKVTATAVFVPVRELDFRLGLRAMEHSYPGTSRFRVDKKATDLAALTTLADGGTLFVSQKQHSLSASFWQQPGGGSTTDIVGIATPSDANVRPTEPIAFYADTLDERAPFRLWLDNEFLISSGEQLNDWRVPLRGRAFDSFTLEQAAEMVVTSTLASGTGATDLTISLPTGTTAAGLQGSSFTGISFRGYRYLRLRMKASTNETVTVSIGSKTWSADKTGAALALTTSYANFDIDLCSPTSETASVDDTDSFFPLPTVDGEYWGVSASSSIVIGSISGGVTVDVESVKLRRDIYSRATFLQPFPYDWRSAGDGSEYVPEIIDGDTDGRRSLPNGAVHFYRTGSVYVIRSLSELIDSINGNSGAFPTDGWTATEETVFPDDYHDNDLPACFVHGAGAKYAGTAFDYGFDKDASSALSVQAQSLLDSLEWPALWGDGAFYIDGGYSGQGVIAGLKILHCQAVGLVLQENSLPASGVTVSIEGGADGQGVTGSNGSYQTGLPFPKGGILRDITADVGPSPVPSGAFLSVNRKRRRMCFRVEPGTPDVGVLEIDSPQAWLHLGVGKRIRTYNVMTGAVTFESEEYPDVDAWVEFKVENRRAALYAVGQDGTTFRVYVSEDGGTTGTEILTVTANSIALDADSEQGVLSFWHENGAGVLLDQSQDSGATWVNDVPVEYDGAQLDATLLCARHDPRAGGRIHLAVDIGGSKAVLYSDDLGKTFTLELT